MKLPPGLTDFLKKWHLPLILLSAFIFRLILFTPGFLEVDSLSYLLIAKDLRSALLAGNLFSFLNHPPNGFLFWPPLFPIIAAIIPFPIDIAPSLVSILCGTLLILPIYYIAYSIWNKNTAILAGIITAFFPMLAYYNAIGRTESLYLLFLFLAIWQLNKVLNENRLLPGLWAGIFFGLAFLTRFEGSLAMTISGLLVFFSVFSLKNKSHRLLSLILLCIGFIIISLPYWVFLHYNLGGFHVIPPSIALHNEMEWRWKLTRPFSHFVSIFGLPGEKNLNELKEIASYYNILPKDPEFTTRIKAYFMYLPEGIVALLANFSPFYFISFVFSLPLALRNRKAHFLLWFLVMAVPISFLTFWDTNPRYYAFMIPVAIILVGPWLLGIFEAPEKVPMKILILLGIGLCLSWMFPLSDHLHPLYLDLRTIIRLLPGLFNISLFVFLFWIIILGLIDWQFRIRTAFIVGGTGLLLLLIITAFSYFARGSPSQAGGGEVLSMAIYSGYRSIVLWILSCGIFWELFSRISRSSSYIPLARSRVIILTASVLLLLCIQNIISIGNVMDRHRFLTSL
ncbi:MAG: glycosyltransferase family 39 protein, partial [Candidatus Eremiobacteraeota bacterium]|nr:glycosyltransferase family 39 protein [Candidatus Eremiobacteraeota bacterium]